MAGVIQCMRSQEDNGAGDLLQIERGAIPGGSKQNSGSMEVPSMQIKIQCDPKLARVIKGELELRQPQHPRPSASASIQNRERRRRATLFKRSSLESLRDSISTRRVEERKQAWPSCERNCPTCLAIRRHIGYEISSTFGRTFGPPCLVRPKRVSDTLSNDRLGWRAKRVRTPPLVIRSAGSARFGIAVFRTKYGPLWSRGIRCM
jgi:hypothetical protein